MMLTTKRFLKQGLQVGPWKVTRKVLLVVVAVCLVVLSFGALMLETHAFDSRASASEWEDRDDNSYEKSDDDDDEDEDWEFGGGDLLMVVLMGIAGVVILLSVLACFFAQVNPPSHLDARGNEQVFTIQLTKPSIGPQHPQSITHYQQYHLQQYELQQQQQQQQEQQQQQQQQQRARQSRATAPTAHAPHARSPPPPYSPPATANSPSNMAEHTTEKPPPYSP